MRFYKLSAAERAKIEAFNANQKDNLLIICDHGEGRIGIEADDIESLKYDSYFKELGEFLEPTRIVTIDKGTLEAA
ncbi:MAG: hypothetical protein ACW99G_23535 [Candidatus Thorarchaeota archaeon]|jgi:hypothetical protein